MKALLTVTILVGSAIASNVMATEGVTCTANRAGAKTVDVTLSAPVKNINWLVDYFTSEEDNRETEFFPNCAPLSAKTGSCPAEADSFRTELEPYHALSSYSKVRVTVQSGKEPVASCDLDLDRAPTSLAGFGVPLPPQARASRRRH